MCLEYDARRTRELRQKLKLGGDEMILYKLVDYYTNNDQDVGLCGFYQSDYKYKAGYNYSDRATIVLDEDEKTDQEVYKGIHVYVHKRKNGTYYRDAPLEIPVTVKLKDFVAAGKGGEAVFTKIYIKSKDYKNALKLGKKYYED